ncbi:hypothetical protein EJ02DRAFT_199028 [Clathrospora elynae]|uniref:Uncharacterized protein n=1 Tax=Clathrospora elynae TaxID=706981 RepID=A0A6A5T2N1_9PLEO|nr:hypothetical protein EJ02DRAFT_199028 [Clathrospora elynae]
MLQRGTKRRRENSLERNLEKSHKRLCLVKWEELAIDRKIKKKDDAIRKVDQERETLQNDRRALRAEYAKLGITSLDAAARSYSQAWNLAFASTLLDRLPRELRDMVYAQIWSVDYIEENFMSMVGISKGLSRAKAVPHVVDTSYVGLEMGLEIVEAYYGHAVGNGMFEAQHLRDVDRLIDCDAFNVGVDPATVLREMGIKFHLDELADAKRNIDMEEVKRSFDRLLKVVKKKGFKLRIELSQRRIRLNVWPKFFDILRPILLAFEEGGADVAIQWSYTDHDWLYDVSLPLNDLIKQSNPKWKVDIQTALEYEETIEEQHREYLFEDEEDYDPEDYYTESNSESNSENDYDDDEDGFGYGFGTWLLII